MFATDGICINHRAVEAAHELSSQNAPLKSRYHLPIRSESGSNHHSKQINALLEPIYIIQQWSIKPKYLISSVAKDTNNRERIW